MVAVVATIIVVALSGALVASVAFVCRVMGVWRLTMLLNGGEEKTGLTPRNQKSKDGYMGQTESQSSHKSQSSSTNQQYSAPSSLPDPLPDPGDADGQVDSSPVSVDSMSITSEVSTSSERRLKRAISCDSVASDSSVLDWEPDPPRIGQLEFGLEYDGDVGELAVSVIQARGLEPDEITGTLDTFIKLWLMPGKEGRAQTKVQRSSVDPVYKERFLFPVDQDALDSSQVFFQVYSSDKYARHKLQGETDIRLGDVQLKHPLRLWMNLRDLDEKPTELGDIMFSLSYLPTAERLTVVVVKARSLHWGRGRESGDCFVKVYLLQNGRKVSKKKTSVKRDVKNPIFNEAMIFSVPANTLNNIQLRVSIVEHVTDSKYQSFGHVIVGSNLSGTAVTHWNQMMTSLRKPIAMWHRIIK